jgi:hypothetical protein
MKRTIMMMVVMAMFFTMQTALMAAGPSPSPDLRRQLYELNSLLAVETLQVQVQNQDNSWRVDGSADFIDGETSLQMDISAGPGLYRGYASWNDKWGNPLFNSYDYKLTVFNAGVNMKDFPVYLVQYRNIQLKIEGPNSHDEVWVNGQQAWFFSGYWHVPINEPWNVDELSIVWTGHGGWELPVDPSYPFGEVIVVTADGMNPGQDSVSQMAALSYSGEDSWTYGISSYMYMVGDSQGNVSALFAADIPEGTKVMVFFSYYDQKFGTIEYFNTTVKTVNKNPEGLVILVPMVGTWFDESRTQVRIVYKDSDGKYWQTWAQVGGPG